MSWDGWSVVAPDYITVLITARNLYFVSYFWTFLFSISRLYQSIADWSGISSQTELIE